jgi:hypothetical protein
VLSEPLEQVFTRRFGPIPAIRRTDQQGEWGTVGQQRTIDFTDPGSVRERLTVVERPRRFGYTLSDVVGPMKLLITEVGGLWSFEPAGTGTRITWSWTVHPAGAVGRLAMPLFGRLWQGYARRSLAHLETLVTTAPRR